MHPLQHHPLPGLDARRLRALEAAGLSHLEDLVQAGPERLATLTQFDAKTCRALVRLAEGALHKESVTVIPLADVAGGSSRLVRGLETARRIERTHTALRKALALLPAEPKEKWRRTVKRARKQLHRLEEALTRLQQSLLAEGVSSAGDQHLRGLLEDLDGELAIRAQARPCRRSFRALARCARAGRKSLRPD